MDKKIQTEGSAAAEGTPPCVWLVLQGISLCCKVKRVLAIKHNMLVYCWKVQVFFADTM